MSSGNDEEWCEEVTISPGEYRQRGRHRAAEAGRVRHVEHAGRRVQYYRRVEGVRESALGGMWNPVYFNYGIAIHGALNVPLHPASHGCIRIPLTLSEYFQDLVADGDQVFVFDGVEEPEGTAPSRRRSTGATPTTSTTDHHGARRTGTRRRPRRSLPRPVGDLGARVPVQGVHSDRGHESAWPNERSRRCWPLRPT